MESRNLILFETMSRYHRRLRFDTSNDGSVLGDKLPPIRACTCTPSDTLEHSQIFLEDDNLALYLFGVIRKNKLNDVKMI